MSEPGREKGGLLARVLAPVNARFGWSFVVEILQLISSVLLLLLLARLFVPVVYGELSAVQALAGNVLSVAGLGTHILLMSRVSRGEPLARSWGRSLGLGLASTGLWYVALVALRGWLLPYVDGRVFALLVAGYLVFFWVSELATYLAIGLGELKVAAELRAWLLLFRLAALGLFVLLPSRSLLTWACLSAVSMASGAVFAVFFVRRRFGVGFGFGRVQRSDIGEGFPYAISGGSESTVDRADVWMLESFGHRSDAGVYAAGGRIVQFGYMPMRILMRSMDRDLYRAGGDGLRPALRVSRRMAPTAFGLGALAAVGLFVLAPIMPVLLGDEWRESVSVIRMLSVLPLFRSVQYLLGNALTACGRQWWRFGATAVALVVNVGLNLALLPNGSWRTAAYTTFVAETALALVLAVVVVVLVALEPAYPRRSPSDSRTLR